MPKNRTKTLSAKYRTPSLPKGYSNFVVFSADAVEFMRDKVELEFAGVTVVEVCGMRGKEGEFENCSVEVELKRDFPVRCLSDV